MQLEQFLEHSAGRWPDKTALVAGPRRLTYRELDQQANRFAHSLIENGVERGDRVAVYLENSVETVVAIFAILKAGAVFVVINTATKPEKIAYVLNNCRAKALVTDDHRVRSAASAWQAAPHLLTIWVKGGGAEPVDGKRVWSLEAALSVADNNATRPPERAIDLDLAALIYTSGSTGRPKGVMVTHLNMVSVATSIETYLHNEESDVILSVLPLSFSYGLYQAFVTFKTGATLVLERSFTYPYAVLEVMKREAVTGFALVPTIAAILLQLNLEKYPLPALRYITNAAAALPGHHLAQLRGLWPQVKIYSMYGQTECARIAYLEPDQLDIRPSSVGRGMPNQEVWLVDETGHRVPPGGRGELVVRGAHVARGYWEDPEGSARAFRAGLFPGETVLYTGDLFRMDDEGYLYFVSRKDDIIKTRGEKVSPKEVEEVLYAIPGVSEAVVFGVPDPVLGQAVKALVVQQEGATLRDKDILKYCAARLEDFMVPKHVEFVSGLPKTANGKISRREAAMAVAGGQA